MRIIGHFQERDLDDAINGRDFAQLSASLQHPLLDRAGKSTFNLVHARHKRLLSKPTLYKRLEQVDVKPKALAWRVFRLWPGGFPCVMRNTCNMATIKTCSGEPAPLFWLNEHGHEGNSAWPSP